MKVVEVDGCAVLLSKPELHLVTEVSVDQS